MANMNEDNNDTITLMHPCLHVGLINIPLQCETYCLSWIYSHNKITAILNHQSRTGHRILAELIKKYPILQ